MLDASTRRDTLLLLVCSIIATAPLLHTGLYRGHDLEFEVVRVAEYVHQLSAGIWPVRWGANLEGGHGYPIYNFFPPLFLTLSSAFSIAGGFSILNSIKAALFSLTFLAGLGMYAFAREHFDRAGALLTAGLYILAPYHFVAIFVRNAFSEFAAMAVIPLVFLGLARLLKAERFQWQAAFPLLAGSTLFVLSHNLSVIMYAPLITAYLIVVMITTGQWYKLRWTVPPLAAAFALTAFYTLPLLFEVQYVQTWVLMIGKFDVLHNFFSLAKLSGWATPFTWVLIAAMAIVATLWRKNIPTATFTLFVAFFALLLIMLYMITPASRYLWEWMPFMKWLQFPWRLLSPASFLICFCAGTLASAPLRNSSVRSACVLGVIATGAASLAMYSRPGNYSLIPDTMLTQERIREDQRRTTVLYEYLPVWVKEQSEAPVKEWLTSSAKVTMREIQRSPLYHAYSIFTPEETLLTFHLHYFPGWRVYVNGKIVTPAINRRGFIEVRIGAGQSLVETKFEDTNIRRLGNRLSIAALIMIFLGGIWSLKHSRSAQRTLQT